MSYLRKFPLDELKVDRSFVNAHSGQPGGREHGDRYAIIQLANTLRFTTTAEGIETEAQREALRATGCDFGLGYLIAAPLNPAQLRDLLATATHVQIEEYA